MDTMGKTPDLIGESVGRLDVHEKVTGAAVFADDLQFNYVIKGRPKSIYSVWNKMKKQGIPFEEVYDLFAIRIIIDTTLKKVVSKVRRKIYLK